MNPIEIFLSTLTAAERSVLDGLRTPADIQAYLDSTPYPALDDNRSPLQVMRVRLAHCLDGGLFGAAALRLLGFPPVILDLQPDPGMDDDHVLALYRIDGCWGAIAKSNFTGLRFREPIHRSLRELVLTYFEEFYSLHGEKTLRFYTRPVKLTRFDHLNWMCDTKGANAIEIYLKKAPRVPLLRPGMAARLLPVDQLSYQSGMLGANLEGIYKPAKKQKENQ